MCPLLTHEEFYLFLIIASLAFVSQKQTSENDLLQEVTWPSHWHRNDQASKKEKHIFSREHAEEWDQMER